MEAAAGLVRERLRHEGRQKAVVACDLLDEGAERNHAVRNRERLSVTDVDLDLACRVLGVRLLDGDPHIGELVPDRTDDMLELGGAGKAVELVSDLHRSQGFGIQQIELELGAYRHPVSHRRGAGHLRLQHSARIDRDRLVVGAQRAPETEGAAFLPRHCVHLSAREDVHVRVAVVHVDVGRIPYVAGHVAGEHRDGERIAGFVHPRPLPGGVSACPAGGRSCRRAPGRRCGCLRGVPSGRSP